MTHKHWITLGIVVVLFFMFNNGSLNTLLTPKTTATA